MEVLFFLEDGSEVWQKLGEEAENGGHSMVTVDNIDRVNK
jgi:hypothetical protein